MTTYGPKSSGSHQHNTALLKFISDSSNYISTLPNFSKYCIWRYTIGSASINSRLIFGKLSDNSAYWTYLFFKFYKNTFPNGTKIPNGFTQFKKYFDNPELFGKSNKQAVAESVINSYIEHLQSIILFAPKTTGSFNVFKVASKYPALPNPGDNLPVKVLQLPFNSVTISPTLNYAPFISPTATCCLFNIEIPKGSSCLFVPTDLHAYNFEHEIILPFNCVFSVDIIRDDTLNYVDPSTVNIVEFQSKDKIKMGNVYGINEYFPCKQQCIVKSKMFTTYYCYYSNPS